MKIIFIGRLGKPITEEKLAILNEGLSAVAGPEHTVNSENLQNLIVHLEEHSIKDGISIKTRLPDKSGSVILQRTLAGWNVVSIKSQLVIEL